jgi:hypothetical protein
VPELGSQPSAAQEEVERTKQAAEAGAAVALPVTDAESAPAPEAEAEAAVAQAAAPTSAPAAGSGINARGGKRFETARVDEEATPPTLFEAAQAERQRRQQSPSSEVVITNDNLADFGGSGSLTELVTTGDAEAAPAAATTPAANPAQDDPELYWRTVARDARLAWRAAADRVSDLEAEVARLRYEFYSQDDPHYRDGEIKPAWDRAALELDQARLRAKDLEYQVERILESGYRADALPGWLREGIEFEPVAVPDDEDPTQTEPSEAQAIEPPQFEDPPR